MEQNFLKYPGLALAIGIASRALFGFAAEPESLSLERALQLALANNPGLRASASRVTAASGRAEQARLWSNPALTFSIEDAPLRRGSFSDSKDTIGMEQTVPFPGKKKLDSQIGAAGVRLTEAELSLRRLELVREVKTVFYRALASERLVGVAAELVRVAESSAATARKRVEAGAAGDQEQLRAEILLEQVRTEEFGQRRELATAREELGRVVGRLDVKDMPLTGALSDRPDAALLQAGSAHLLSTHPSAVAARKTRDRLELELRRARLEPYPDVTVGVDGGREGHDNNAILEFRVSLPVPIIDRSKGRKQEAAANLRGAEAELTATEQRLLTDWNVACQRFRTAAEQVSAYRDRILPKANDALRLVQTGFEQGKFGLIDLLDTQRTTAEARLAYQQKLLELNIAQAELESLLGRMPVPPQPAEPTQSRAKE